MEKRSEPGNNRLSNIDRKRFAIAAQKRSVKIAKIQNESSKRKRARDCRESRRVPRKQAFQMRQEKQPKPNIKRLTDL
jgi:hypothetical protein